MNLAFALMAQFGKPVVRLEEICDEYLGMSKAVATQHAKAGTLSIPVYRATDSNKAPWLVNLSDLAQCFEQKRDEAASDMVA
ncbi:pyocin activator protein PrtN [Parashewanella curva]|uniref:Pyocin activator protein PrtN n=1 Tax=Parashewanella curva TaxID=2338552 RepID=A0A3L8Q2E9_9GAMM|nr:pyocin activator PrtN family protein [Parashewanella curva]RLV60973.1 pyocin activator protein PrtN [Parashewanella curva]